MRLLRAFTLLATSASLASALPVEEKLKPRVCGDIILPEVINQLSAASPDTNFDNTADTDFSVFISQNAGPTDQNDLLLGFYVPTSSYGCTLGLTFPSPYTFSYYTGATPTLNIYTVPWPLPSAPTYNNIIPNQGSLFGTVTVLEGQSSVVNAESCPNVSGGGLAFVVGYADWITAAGSNFEFGLNDGDDDPPEIVTPQEPLFAKLPLEIRLKIWHILFKRPLGIVLTLVHYKLSICYRRTTLAVYSYVWQTNRQRQYEDYYLPSYDNKSIKWKTIRFATTPTEEQKALIERGEFGVEGKLPKYIDEKRGIEVTPHVNRRPGVDVKVVNHVLVATTGIWGVDMLCTSKQFAKECEEVLYGENTFVFDTRGNAPFTHHHDIHDHDAFNKLPNHIPGLHYKDGTPVSYYQEKSAIDKMFDKSDGAFHYKFIYRDPLTKFCHTIDRENTALLRQVQIEGNFRTAENHWAYKHSCPIGFARLLPIRNTVLKHCCPNLREVILVNGSNNELFGDDLESRSGKIYEERVDDTVKNLVNALPNLKKLQLGSLYRIPVDDENTDWGKALRWEKIVKDRVKENLRQERLQERKAKREKMKDLG
ncbi:hypothetical protein G7Y89_g6973 [Cudoniella acicularis]|uniref:Ubiquitin 3 binding protein But2 C-terminal domain-containing protein n=1 Tax=Cudoniella acicularis TaxID=354080 RepID=A0A8H4RLA3_9HELO|nr:hypothetical protein G7Y89_g6973 [Cudoniella acicularis]